MRIVWDEAKRRLNLVKHGIDFAEVASGFDFERAIRFPARPSDSGRARIVPIGAFRGETIVVAVASPLGAEALSLVSLRPAGGNPEPTDEELAQGVPLAVAMPELAEAIRRQRGEAESAQDFVWVRLDRDVIEAFRDSGSRWQVRLNDLLKEAIARGALDPRSGKLRPSEAHPPKPMAASTRAGVEVFRGGRGRDQPGSRPSNSHFSNKRVRASGVCDSSRLWGGLRTMSIGCGRGAGISRTSGAAATADIR